MPRQSRSSGRSAPSRGAHTSARSAPPPAQPPATQQQHHAQPPAHMPPQQPQAPGLFGQMASTAAGVAVGSTVGHGLSSMLFGGGGSREAAPAPAAEPQNQSFEQRTMGGSCEIQAKSFTQCLDATKGDIQGCQYYLDQLKACQAAAAPY